ncbi:MAG TPA: SPOR domain-containing protein [Sphingobacteriaceae bacterium]|nr:SPOR domain-containing protein [Sphingobacteriaceae bacterium]
MAGQRGPRRRLRRVRRRRDTVLRGVLAVVLLLAAGAAAVGVGYYLGSNLLAGIGAPADSQGSDPGDGPDSAPGEPTVDPFPDPSSGDDEDDPNGTDDEPGAGEGDEGGDDEEDAGQAEDEEDDEPVDRPPVQVRAPAVTLYAVQAGNFSTRNNAQQMVQQLREAGLPAAVADYDGYRVWVGLYDADAQARTAAAQVRQSEQDAFVHPWVLSADGLLPGVEGADHLARLIAALPETTRQFAHVWTTRAMGGDQWQQDVAAVRERIIALQEQTLALTVPEELDDLAEDLIDYVSRASGLAASLWDLAQGNISSAQAGDLMVEHMELAARAARILQAVDQE